MRFYYDNKTGFYADNMKRMTITHTVFHERRPNSIECEDNASKFAFLFGPE